MDINALLSQLAAGEASDLHLVTGQPPFLRMQGHLTRQGDTPVSSAAIDEFLQAHLSSEQMAQVAEGRRGDIETTLALDEGRRPYRLRVFREHTGLSVIVRWLPIEVPALEDIYMGEERFPALHETLRSKGGLIIVTGPTGCGKTTTLFAMVETINRTAAKRIITLEDPIESVFASKQSLISQRWVGQDVSDFPAGLRAAFHDDVDVVLVGEARNIETLYLMMNLAEAGHLVLTILHRETATSAVQMIVDAFPDGQRSAIRRQLAKTLVAVVAQKLLRRSDRTGRMPANEILLASPRVRKLIEEGQEDLSVAIEAGRDLGMQTMDDSLVSLFESGLISRETAWENLEDKGRLRRKEEASPAE